MFDKNPELNRPVYNVEFPYGAVKQYASNLFAMNIIRQVNSDGHNSKTLYGIVDYKQNYSDVSKANAFVTTNRGVVNLRQTTIGYKLLIQCKDDTTTWMLLKILKDFNPVEVA